MASSKFMSQVSALSDTGLNMAANGFNQKASAPKSTSPVHNRGLTLGGKQHLTGGSSGGSQAKAIHANLAAPKAPSHPAVAKNQGGKPGVKWG